jgi:hypothetical protein
VQGLTRLMAATALSVAAYASCAATPAVAVGGGTGHCAVDLSGHWVTVQCTYRAGSGSGSGGGDNVQHGCTIGAPLTQAQAEQLGLQWPPPKGYSWALMDCVGGRTTDGGPQAVLLNDRTGAPRVTPRQLLAEALAELQIPVLPAQTAPPRGKDGLVGLPEWFWVPGADWHTRSVTVRAGPVWATALATPTGVAFEPGGGLSLVSCAGPGAAYDAAKPASAQHTDCSYTYQQPSAGQPGDAYRAGVIVTWRVSWTGSGGVGGVLDPGMQVPAMFSLQVAQGEALVNTP